ncbi:MAG: prepilin-type N-terminal cleavage/methylation domain-containing protein [Planctomycetia bacterium]|nr:prepilin-type N-terminal cleavage/methylation domain-containing protein [Planctomycetia bacterium]
MTTRIGGNQGATWSNISRRIKRAGLTLMELVVVLAVLAAVAGILAPLLPNLLRRAHKATDATQTGELSKAIQMYQASFISYPDNFDSLVGADGAFPTYLPTDDAADGPFGGFVKAATLTADEAGALNRVGIAFVQPLLSAPTAAPTAADYSAGFHPTMNPYPSGSTIASNKVTVSGNTTTKFAILNLPVTTTAPDGSGGTTTTTTTTKVPARFLQTLRDADPTARYVVFGVGSRSSMIGQTIQEAPMSTPQKKSFTPDNTYCRVGAIFKISGVEVERSERARFVCTVALEDDELETTEKDIVGYYQVSRDPRN